MAFRRAINFRARAVTALQSGGRRGERSFAAIRQSSLLHFFVPSFIATIVFFIQMLKDGGRDAGFLFTGDVLGYFWPAIIKIHSLFHAGIFEAIDFSSYNASSPFLLTANLFSVHPLIVFPSFLIPEDMKLQQAGYWLVLLFVVHSFLASFYAHRLMCEFFGFRFLTGAMVGILFGFSYYITSAMGEPPFTFSVAVLPWMAYAALKAAFRPSPRTFLWGCLPVIFGILGGYGPLGLASAGLAVLIAAFRIFVLDASRSVVQRLSRFSFSLVPFVASALILAPYLISVLDYNSATASGTTTSLFFSAQQLAEVPQSILRIISSHFAVPTPYYEFTPTWGFGSIVIALIFFMGFGTVQALDAREQKIFFSAFALYCLSVLAIYGSFSPISNVIYNFIPIVGKMHLYQRFLFPTSLFYAIVVTLMLKAIVEVRPPVALRVIWLLSIALCFSAALILAFQPALAAAMSLTPSIVFDLMLAILVPTFLRFSTPRLSFVAVTALLFIPPLGMSYDFSQGGYYFSLQRNRVPEMLDADAKSSIVAFMKRNSKKSIIKYADITPFWDPKGVETFPKSFPYFELEQANLSSYGGFAFYLAPLKSYTDKMPVEGPTVALQPDWDLVRAQGGDFVVALATDVKAGRLDGVASPDDIAAAMPLPNAALLVPLHSLQQGRAEKDALFDNGYFRLNRGLISTDRDKVDLAVGKVATASGGINAAPAVDGNTDGDFAHGSVTHSGRDPNAWLQVDLGAEHPIDDVTIWGRTDCCGERLHDYWLFLSDTPLPASATAAEIAKMPGVWSVRRNSPPRPSSRIDTDNRTARYVRVQFGATTDPNEAFMSIAELQVFEGSKAAAPTAADQDGTRVVEFKTNDANQVALDVSATHPVSVDYLLTPNPSFTYTLNEESVTPIQHDGLIGFNLPAGRSRLRIVYHNSLLVVFWIVYALYFMLLLLSFLVPWILRLIRAVQSRSDLGLAR